MPTDYTDYSSKVSTTGLDDTYPVQGTNNSSAGLRNNFAVIKGTFGQVALELTQLRDYVLRKLDEGEIFSHDNDLNFYKLIKAQLKSYSETFFNIGEADTVINANFLNGNFQKVTLTRTADLSLLNFPSHNAVGRLTLWVTVNNIAHKIFMPPDIIYGTNVPYVTGNQIIFPQEGNYLIEIISVNLANQFWLVGVHGLSSGGTSGGSNYQLPMASVSTLGGVMVDGTTIGIRNGIISVIGGTGGGGFIIGATGAQGPQGASGPQGVQGLQGAPGPAGPESIVKTGSVHSYMYAGAKATGNQNPFHMVTLSGVGENGTIELTLAHHHSGGGQHGAYSRIAYATNAYTGIVELEKYEKSFDSGSMTGNVGFEVTRPITGNLEIRWLGNVSVDPNYSFYMTINSNKAITIHKIGLD